MTTTTVLCIAPEGPLTESIRKVVSATAGCCFERVGRPETALLRVLHGDVGLVLAYIADSRDPRGVIGLLILPSIVTPPEISSLILIITPMVLR